jgi:hypothetical protein
MRIEVLNPIYQLKLEEIRRGQARLQMAKEFFTQKLSKMKASKLICISKR